MKMTKQRPTKPGWYWYMLPGSWALQPVFVFEYEDDELFYTVDALSERYANEADGFEMALASENALWSREAIAMPDMECE